MVRLLLSQREENARETCARCINRRGATCKYPIIMEYCDNAVGGMTIRTAKLISFSDDGMTCQLFREAKE